MRRLSLFRGVGNGPAPARGGGGRGASPACAWTRDPAPGRVAGRFVLDGKALSPSGGPYARWRVTFDAAGMTSLVPPEKANRSTPKNATRWHEVRLCHSCR